MGVACWEGLLIGNFLISIVAGIAVSVFSLAKIITWLLTDHPVMVWAFFFGLVLASTWFVGKDIKEWNKKTIPAFIIGVAVVNAILNQKYRSMQEKHIAVILKVGDLQEICLEEEEIVILLSNLLDNAIRESEKVLKNTGKAVIHLKLECEEHKLIFAVRNPVTEKVEIENDTIKSKRGDHHGIGLLNVKAVVDKYGGDMVLSCDENEFKAVVIL